MSRFVRCLSFAAGITAIAVAGVLLGWWNTHLRPDNSVSFNHQPDGVPAASSATVPSPPAANVSATTLEIMKAPPVARREQVALSTKWEDQVADLLNGPLSNADKSAALLEMFPRLPEEGQTEIATALSNLLPDAQYADLGQYITNTAIAEGVRELLVTQLMFRPDAIRLPWLLEVARSQQGAGAADAKGLLGVLLDQDNGDDWRLWQTKVEQHLQSKPD